MQQLKIVKIGGKMIEDQTKLDNILDFFSKAEGPKILVHGGASQSDDVLEKLGIEKVKIDGRRITDKATLEVCVMVYAGLLNKQIVADLSKRGLSTIGMSGADLNSIHCIKRPVESIDYGFVGDIHKVSTSAIKGLLDQNIALVFSAITHDNNGQLLNTNGDTIAAALAQALSTEYKVSLLFVFDREGVVKFSGDRELVIPSMTAEHFHDMRESGAIKDGLIPKLSNGFDALGNGIQEVRLGSPKILLDPNSGTKLVHS